MRRIDIISIGLGVLIAGGALFIVFRFLGFDSVNAGIWSQAIFVVLLMVWVLSYVFRAATGTMTYNQQLDNYEDAVLQKRLDELSPEELKILQAKLDSSAESSSQATQSPEEVGETPRSIPQ
ncbi:MAG: DUF3007 family protein [Cyanothece sp. SIO2G6]|nr:DUF3007 family protein [Cyanothece sp. SIO2G6]